jgi:hypothetical protein
MRLQLPALQALCALLLRRFMGLLLVVLVLMQQC